MPDPSGRPWRIMLDQWHVTVEYMEGTVEEDETEGVRAVINDALTRWGVEMDERIGYPYMITVDQ